MPRNYKIAKHLHPSIYYRWKSGEHQKVLADEFNVTQSVISRICSAAEKQVEQEHTQRHSIQNSIMDIKPSTRGMV